ncbi:MAG: polymer-forming cytoskeletal protein [Spirochaetia bacterium]
MKDNKELKNYPKATTRFGAETSFKGVLRFTESVRISGRFEGQIHSTGFLYIEETAEVWADITAGIIIIGGTVHGDVEATERLEMLPTGKIYGNVRTVKLRIADGVVFEGKCEMIKNSNSIDVFSAPPDQLKQTVKGV